MQNQFEPESEWLESDGLGGFASGTVTGRRTRRYHALLLNATTPPAGRMILVNGFDAAIDTPAGSFWISSQEYSTDTIAPDGADCLADFQPDPWPRWTYRLSDGTVVEQEVFVPRGRSAVFLRWKLLNSDVPATLHVRPFLSGRDYHSLHHENGGFRFDADTDGDRVTWRPYDGIPAVSALSNGQYQHEPTWYRNFVYEAERDRGLDDTEDLAAPGVFSWDLAAGEALLVFAAEGHEGDLLSDDLNSVHARVRKEEADRRSKFPSRLHHSADAYIVDGRHGKTVVAGFPWLQIGVETPSLHYADFASPPGVSTTPATSWSRGPVRSTRGCCRIFSPTRAMCLSSTPWTLRFGTSLDVTSTLRR